jgi:hypothetical protein
VVKSVGSNGLGSFVCGHRERSRSNCQKRDLGANAVLLPRERLVN